MLNNKHIKNLFSDIGHSLPSKTTYGRILLQLSADKLRRIRNAIHDNQAFLVVNENTLSGTPYLNVLVGSLETSHGRYMQGCGNPGGGG